MTSSKTSLLFLAGAATVIGLAGSVLIFALSTLSGAGIPQSLTLPVAAIPLVASLSVAVLLNTLSLEPARKRLKDSLEIARKALPSGAPSIPAGQSSIEDNLSALSQGIQTIADQMRETRKREKSVIENAADVICVIDINAQILQVNQAAKSVWGYSVDEITGKQLGDYLVKEDVDNTLESVLGAEKSIDRIFFENRFRKKSGEIVDLLWSAHWSVSDGGLFCVAHDITQRKRAEALLRESEERIRGILENLPAGVLVVNKAGLIEFINDTGAGFVGQDAQSIKGMRASEMLGFCKEPFAAKQLDEIIGTDASGFDSQITKLNGERFAAEISLSKLQLGGERCYLVIFLDVTHKHAIEIAKREFVTMVSHDLRTPLTSILSILSYLESGHGGALNEKGASLALRGRKESERLILLIRDLLDLEKMKAGKFTMHFTETQTGEIIKAAVEAVERFAELHKVKLSAELGDGLSCYCDGARIIQVLVNLMDNAIKFSPPEQTVRIEARADSDKDICISVSNKGREIPPEKLSSIFERFEQVEESDAKEKKGSGLGLAICKTIIEQHSGKMWATSSAKEGTRFAFTLPIKEPEKTER